MSKSFGKIDACKKEVLNCKYKCCTFSKNYIVLYPNELEDSKKNKSHIKIIDDNYHGGKKAICLRQCRKDDFKPLDCKSYPLFPFFNEVNDIQFLFGSKFPLLSKDLIVHKIYCLREWKNLLTDDRIYNWLKNIKLIGYEKIDL